jgi:hypothetical protein
LLLEFQREFAAVIDGPTEGPLRVYRNTVLSGCVDALRANYPIVARLLGDEMFDAAAVDHATKCPPRRPALALYGECFADWLAEQPWIWDVAYVPDVARIERFWIEALFAEDTDPLDMSHPRGRGDWQALHLPLHPATRFDWLAMPAMTIWQAQRDSPDKELEPDWKAEGVLITRPRLDVQAIHLDRASHRMLVGIRLGESVGASMNAASSLYPDEDCEALFASLLNLGVFAAPSTERI